MTWPLTPWFPSTTNPARPGLYLTRSMEVTDRAMYWSGVRWEFPPYGVVAHVQNREWRGLAFDPASAVAMKRMHRDSDGTLRAPRGWWVPKP